MKVYCRNGLIISFAFLLLSCASTQSHNSIEDQAGGNSNSSDMEERAKMLIATSLQDEMQGNIELAFQKRQEALELSRKIQHTGLETMALVGIATIYMTQENYNEALKLYQSAEKLIIERMGEVTPTIVFILSSIGSVYEELGDFPNAIDYHKQTSGVRPFHFTHFIKRRPGSDPFTSHILLNVISGVYGKKTKSRLCWGVASCDASRCAARSHIFS